MARLKRKNILSAKGKKKKNGSVSSSENKNIDASKGATSLAAYSGNSRKIQPLSAAKSLTRSKLETGRLKRNLEQSIQFLREVKIELKKVTWPTRKQTIGFTVVVIILVIIISFFLGVVDIGLSALIQLVL